MSFFYLFEVEHIFAQTVFKDAKRAQVLASLGYTEEMASNKKALFSNADVVNQIQDAPDSNAWKQVIRDAGMGIVRHEGADNAAGGKQQGKNAFLGSGLIRSTM